MFNFWKKKENPASQKPSQGTLHFVVDNDGKEEKKDIPVLDQTGSLSIEKLEILKKIIEDRRSDKFNALDLKDITITQDIIKINFVETASPSWFQRLANTSKLLTASIENDWKNNTLLVNPKVLDLYPFDKQIARFDGSFDQVNPAQLAGLKVLEESLLSWHPDRCEQRQQFFSNENGASGPLQSVMLKFNLYPNSARAPLKTYDDFVNKIVEDLKTKLGPDDFKTLVKEFGQAKDGSVYISLDPSALEKMKPSEPTMRPSGPR